MTWNRPSATSVVVTVLAVTSILCDPPLDVCYETYEVKNALSCKEPRRVEKISCLEPLNDQHAYGLSTPSNETILFVPPLYYMDRCFDVSKDENLTKVCTQSGQSGDDVESLTTPENHTIWLRSMCDIGLIKTELERDRKFVSSFKFDNGERSCYKIYNANETISPYTCADINIPEICAKEIDGGLVLTSPHGETVHLGRLDGTNVENNCVEVSHGSTKRKVRLEKLEERCVGFTMPSGLRVLVACRHCYRNLVPVSTHNSSLWKQQRAYIKRYFFEDGNRSDSLHINKELRIFENAKLDRLPNLKYSCFDAKSDCHLLTLDSNETVQVYCRNGSYERPGCYKVVDQVDGEESSACARVIDEKCIGVITPKNTVIMFECFEDLLEHQQIEAFLNEELTGYTEGRYLYPRNKYSFMFKNDYHDEVCKTLKKHYTNGSMVTTPDDETLLLQDTTTRNANGYYSLHGFSGGAKTVSTVSLRRVNDRCIGVTTPMGWNIVFVCYDPYASSTEYFLIAMKSKEPTNMY